jgi:hypothetical protein
MPRVAALITLLTLVAGGFPVAAQPTPCAGCCQQAAMHDDDATANCCRVVPAEIPVPGQSTDLTRFIGPIDIAAAVTPYVSAPHVAAPPHSPPDLRLRGMRAVVLRL